MSTTKQLEFILLVREMRKQQKLYFKNRNKETLIRSKQLEIEVDQAIEKMTQTPELFEKEVQS